MPDNPTKKAGSDAKNTSKNTPKKPRKKPHTLWKKGQSGNPKGRPKVPAYVRTLQRLNRTVAVNIFSNLNTMTVEQLEELAADKSLPAIQAAAIQIMIKAIKQGDSAKLNFIIEQSAGRLPETIIHEEIDDVSEEVKKLTDKQLMKLVDKVREDNAGRT